ncbi:Zn-dependent M28 family amino/carboxypeptidase [Sediminihabitans luteus]|uniref:Vacuolar membrane protease n=1 Tax=Sediminihabitans luteus TaxID=1138585 RepID=A0A2M9CZ89_9CELL|nr:M28 family peptidase [Sediminihabitans luteus]PJJ77207.1 Zn-dependent M28 family amino/carboxypeptidase [Sediminihabitans luteus]GII98655.1 aminopeptidase [Sediminihabitans luteus]
MTQTTSRATTLASLLALLVLTVLAVLAVRPPAPHAADAPADEFSAQRAFEHVEAVGQEVHPHGSAAADDVRDHLVRELEHLGLDPEVTRSVGEEGSLGDQARVASVQNVVATIPGTDPTLPVFLVAHYDSAEVSHGANDDGAGVATLLETARALREGPALRNDVVLVLTDAEEACLCGAEAFATSDPRAADGGVVLNVEARGSSGPAIMFETSRGNADLVDEYAKVPYPVGSSMAVEVYRILPNDTDFSPFRDDDRFTGLNSAYIDGSATYHAPQDTPDRMDLASLQQHGSNMLALVRSIGDADVAALARPASSDSTYFPLPGGVLARYPGALVWPLAALAVVAALGLAVVTVRRGRTTPARVALGTAAALVPVALAAVGAQLFWLLLVAVRPGYGEMLDPWRPWWFRVAVLAIVATVLTGWFVAFRRWLGAPALAIGSLVLLALVGVGLAAAVPGGAYLATLPALACAIGGLVAVRLRDGWAARAATTAGAAVGVLVLVPVTLLFFPALGLATGAAPAVCAVLLGLALVPLLGTLLPRDRRWSMSLVGGFAALAVAFTATGLAVDGFDADHPEPTQLMYALDADTGEAQWVSGESSPSPWTAQYVSTATDVSAEYPMVHGDVWTGPAEAADLPAPTAELTADITSGDTRTLTFTLRPGRDVRYVDVVGDGVRSATVAGRDVPVEDGHLDARYYAPDADGVQVVLETAAGGPLDLQLFDGGEGLEDLPGFVARPDDVGVMGSHTSELVLVRRSVTL